MSDLDFIILVLGMDFMILGLNLNLWENLYKMFVFFWVDGFVWGEFEFIFFDCYV